MPDAIWPTTGGESAFHIALTRTQSQAARWEEDGAGAELEWAGAVAEDAVLEAEASIVLAVGWSWLVHGRLLGGQEMLETTQRDVARGNLGHDEAERIKGTGELAEGDERDKRVGRVETLVEEQRVTGKGDGAHLRLSVGSRACPRTM